MNKDISQIRQEYKKSSLNTSDVPSSPFEQFKIWFEQTINSDLFYDPTAFCLSTCGADLVPTSRTLLLKSYDETGFQFFTNYNSKKAKDISENPNASMLFFWDKLERQVRISGIISKIDSLESDNYFNSRPYESRISAIASDQSSEMEKYSDLEDRILILKDKYPVNPPRPEYWGGYKLVPNVFEFWQGKSSRLHDRIKYKTSKNGWEIVKLYP